MSLLSGKIRFDQQPVQNFNRLLEKRNANKIMGLQSIQGIETKQMCDWFDCKLLIVEVRERD
jgi:hypothetical protein